MASLRVRDLGDYIREQRRIAQISLRQLARQAGVSNPYLSQIERGLRKPSAEILQQIARALRISAEALYVQAGILEERPGDSNTPDAITRDAAISERQKQVLLEIYDSFRRENAIRASAEPVPADADLGATPAGPGEWAAEADLIDTVAAESVLGRADMAAAELADEALVGTPVGGRVARRAAGGAKRSAEGAKPRRAGGQSRRPKPAGAAGPDAAPPAAQNAAPSAAGAG